MGRTRRIRVGGLASLILALGLVAASPAPPVGAWSLTTTDDYSTPATWVDGQGRQYVWTAKSITGGVAHTQVDRLLPDGTPDASWGTGGRRDVDLTPPTQGLLWVNRSVDGQGVIGTVLKPASCAQPNCPLTFVRYQPDGTVVGSPVTAGSASAIVRDLPDGSFVTTTSTGGLGWFGPDGTDRGAPQGLTGVTQASLAVDHTGRLLVGTSNGSVVRWPVGGPATTVTTVPCAPGQPPTLGGTITDGGFASVCPATVGGRLVIRRHQANGTVAWTTTDTTVGTHLETPNLVQADGTGRVWVAGIALTPPIDIGTGIHSLGVAGFDQTGPLITGANIPITDEQGKHSAYVAITDLRAAGSEDVVYSSFDNCCLTIGGAVDESTSLTAGRLPRVASAPEGVAEHVTIEAATNTSIDVSFGPEAAAELRREPTGYRVDASGPAGTATATTATAAPGGTLHAHLTGLTGGKAITVTVTPFNDLGDSTNPAVTAPANQASTVLPFATVSAFVARQYQDLMGAAPPPLPQATYDQLANGTTDPASFTANLMATGLGGKEVEPVARLYRAYFLRDPDRSGLSYWVGRRHAGLKLSAISDRFARSSEFTRRYGSLTNKGFVAALYPNVFGRAPDASGLAFWAGRLDAKRATRGQVVLQFSESSEGVRRSTPIVVPLAAAHLLLGRLPTPAERAAWLALASTRHDVIAAIFATPDYAGRVAPVP